MEYIQVIKILFKDAIYNTGVDQIFRYYQSGCFSKVSPGIYPGMLFEGYGKMT